MAAAPAELAVRGLTKSFPGTQALADLTFDVRAGEIHAVVGENGAGKTTLLMILSGVYAPDRGRVLVGGEEVSFTRPSDAIAAGIGTVFQELSLVDGLTVAENVFANRAPTRGPGLIDRPRMERETRELLGLLDSDLRPTRRVASLGVGDRQVVEIAKALSLNARILLLDEPTSALSVDETATLFALLRRLREQGMALVFVSHRLAEVFEIADRTTVLRDGRHMATYLRETVNRDEVVRAMVGRVLSDLYPERAEEPGPPLLELRGVRSGEVGPIDLELREGEILGLAGLRGSGRSRLGRVVFGAEPLEEGELRLGGRPIRIESSWRAVRCGIAFVASDRKGEGLFRRMSLLRNLVAAALPSVTRGGLVSGAAERRLAERLRRELDIRARGVEQVVDSLSGGNQQKAVVARWLATRPRILIVDEPTQGVDVGAKAEIHSLLRALASEGMGVLMISSDLPELLGMSDRIAVMAGGRVRGILDGATATDEEVMQVAAGTAA
jgi:ABC-type sugar transport system ATPase subunit